jgi:hypothetical protein
MEPVENGLDDVTVLLTLEQSIDGFTKVSVVTAKMPKKLKVPRVRGSKPLATKSTEVTTAELDSVNGGRNTVLDGAIWQPKLVETRLSE